MVEITILDGNAIYDCLRMDNKKGRVKRHKYILSNCDNHQTQPFP